MKKIIYYGFLFNYALLSAEFNLLFLNKTDGEINVVLLHNGEIVSLAYGNSKRFFLGGHTLINSILIETLEDRTLYLPEDFGVEDFNAKMAFHITTPSKLNLTAWRNSIKFDSIEKHPEPIGR